MITALGAIYAAGMGLTGFFLFRHYSPRITRWIRSNPPRSVEDWVFVPILIPIGMTVCVVGLWAGSLLWPMTAFIGWRSRRERIALAAAAEIEEERLLLEDIRDSTRGRDDYPSAPHVR